MVHHTRLVLIFPLLELWVLGRCIGWMRHFGVWQVAFGGLGFDDGIYTTVKQFRFDWVMLHSAVFSLSAV